MALTPGEYLRALTETTCESRTEAELQADLNLETGVDLQAYNATLAAISVVVPLANKLLYTVDTNVFAVTTLSAFARTLLDDASAATFLGTLGLSTNIPNLTDAEVSQLETIGANTITQTQWGYVGGNDQQVAQADNVTFANVTVDGDLLFDTADSGLQYGGLCIVGNAVNTSVSSAGDTQYVYFDTDGPSNGITPVNAEDHIVISKTGDYLVVVSLSIENAAGAGHVVTVKVKKNNGATLLPGFVTDRAFSTGTDVGSLSVQGIVTLTAADTIELWATSDSGGAKNILIANAYLSAVQVGA